MSTNAKRLELYESLEIAQDWLTKKASGEDIRSIDLESARVQELSRLEGRSRPTVPTVFDSVQRTGVVQSISDIEDMGGRVVDLIEQLLDNPEQFGIEMVSEFDETILLKEDL